MKQKLFRQDLFFRIRVVPVAVPSLSERRDDIPVLVAEFADRYSNSYRLPRIVIGERAMARMKAYTWPGNVRELENCVKYLTCLQLLRPVDPFDLPLLDREAPDDTVHIVNLARSGPLKQVKRELVDQLERIYLEEALRRSGGNIAAAARASCKQRRAFFELMRKHGVAAVPETGRDTVRNKGNNRKRRFGEQMGEFLRGLLQVRSPILPAPVPRPSPEKWAVVDCTSTGVMTSLDLELDPGKAPGRQTRDLEASGLLHFPSGNTVVLEQIIAKDYANALAFIPFPDKPGVWKFVVGGDEQPLRQDPRPDHLLRTEAAGPGDNQGRGAVV